MNAEEERRNGQIVLQRQCALGSTERHAERGGPGCLRSRSLQLCSFSTNCRRGLERVKT